MFKIRHKKNGEVYTVYAFNPTDGGMFLIWTPEKFWSWVPMYCYAPLEGDAVKISLYD